MKRLLRRPQIKIFQFFKTEVNWLSDMPSDSGYICEGQKILCWKLGRGCHFGRNGTKYIFLFSFYVLFFFFFFFLLFAVFFNKNLIFILFIFIFYFIIYLFTGSDQPPNLSRSITQRLFYEAC